MKMKELLELSGWDVVILFGVFQLPTMETQNMLSTDKIMTEK